MTILKFAIPLFFVAIIFEIAYDIFKRTGYYRINDTIASLATGVLNRTLGLFTQFVQIGIFAWIGTHVAVTHIPRSVFSSESVGGLLAWALALVAYDFLYYWYHRMGHERSILWASHVVHHQSEEFNLSTALRQSSSNFLLGWIFYLPLVILGLPADVLVTVAAIDLVYQFWVHTRFIPKLGWLEYILVTPSNHRVHHAQNQMYIDKNYGGVFIFWDRLFGTFQEELRDVEIVYGVTKPTEAWNPFLVNLQMYNAMFRDSMNTQSWKNKFLIWTGRNGWRPRDVVDRFPWKRTRLDDFQKFNPSISPSTTYYALSHFIVVLFAVMMLLKNAPGLSWWQQATVCTAIWITLLCLSLLLEGTSAQPFARFFEVARLMLFGFSLIVMALRASPTAGLTIAAAYTILSSLAMITFKVGLDQETSATAQRT